MDRVEVPRGDLPEKPDLLSPPYLEQPYQCASVVIVYGFRALATLDIEIDGAVVISGAFGGLPMPHGAKLKLPAPLKAGQVLRARQNFGPLQSDWSAPVTTRDHTKEFPAGPPRPRINPLPVFECGVRTGVDNLIPGGNVWITANGTEVGRTEGCRPHEGVNIAPPYSLLQRVHAWAEICKDPSPPSRLAIAIMPPRPLPPVGFKRIFVGGQQLIITNVVNGAKVTIERNGVHLGTWGCWGFELHIGPFDPFVLTDRFRAWQSMCAGDDSPPTDTPVDPCAALPAPRIGPVQAGDPFITVTDSVPDAVIKVWVNLAHVGTGAAPRVFLGGTVLRLGDTVHVAQDLEGCRGTTAIQVRVPCVNAPVTANPADLDLFPVGQVEYDDDDGVRGIVYYPANEDGEGTPFNDRLAKLGRVPIVFMAHGNHSPDDPSHLGYDYFQIDLASMGIIAVSIDANDLNGGPSGVGNIEDRADRIIQTIKHFQALDGDSSSLFFQHIDFTRTGLMGHSRGGEAVINVPLVIRLGGVAIRAVLALAPTNWRWWGRGPTLRPNGYAFMTILPAGDGDVVDNNGAQFYDQASGAPFRSQLYVHFTNHNFFNRRWIDDDTDPGTPAPMPRFEHERILTAYGCALFRNALLGHATRKYLTGHEKPFGVATQHVHLAYHEKIEQVDVDHHDERNGIGTNTIGLPTSQSGGLSADEFEFAQTPFGGGAPGSFNGSFAGMTVGMVARPGGTTRLFRSEVGNFDVVGREIWIRAAEVMMGSIPDGATGFQIGLEDAAGIRSFVDVNDVGGLARPYLHPTSPKTILSTSRFKAECFRFGDKRIDLRNIRALLIACDRNDQRALAFDDLQVVTL